MKGLRGGGGTLQQFFCCREGKRFLGNPHSLAEKNRIEPGIKGFYRQIAQNEAWNPAQQQESGQLCENNLEDSGVSQADRSEYAVLGQALLYGYTEYTV